MKKIILILLLFQICAGFGQEVKIPDSIRLKAPPQKFAIRCVSSNIKFKPALYVVDGKIISQKEFSILDPKTIDSVHILKDEYLKFCSGRPIVIIRTKKAPNSKK